jgi:SAM-dependent methyltransferase
MVAVGPAGAVAPSGRGMKQAKEVTMSRRLTRFRFPLAIVVAAGLALPHAAQDAALAPPARVPDVIYVPTPEAVVDAMLDMARVGKDDVVYDLGCGDGRIVIEAAKRGAKRAVGVDIDPERIAEARANAKEAGVGDKVEFVEGDLFETDLKGATVVTLYLLPDLNLRLRPKLLELPRGTRVVSHAFDMGDWKPERTRTVEGKHVYLWTVPGPKRAQARSGK